VAAGAGYYVLAPGSDEADQPAPQGAYDREAAVRAYQFGFAPDTITVKKGERVRLEIINSDVVHGVIVPDLGVEGKDFIVFTPQRAGEFAFYCDNYCGSGHGRMQGKLVVEP
jgi:cytochrome c oxidase subunit 2